VYFATLIGLVVGIVFLSIVCISKQCGEGDEVMSVSDALKYSQTLNTTMSE
jgi:hypothetical protein